MFQPILFSKTSKYRFQENKMFSLPSSESILLNLGLHLPVSLEAGNGVVLC